MSLIGILAIVIVAWFAAGTIVNVRKGRELMRWMQSGLPVLGERTTVRWLGSTAAELALRDAREPFASVTLVIFLEARDLPWMWALGRLHGRRDTLIVRGTLASPPGLEVEALDAGSWSGREARGRVPLEWNVRRAQKSGDLVVHYPTGMRLDRIDALIGLAERSGIGPLRRLALRRSDPQFQIHVALPDRSRPARGFFEAVRAVAERARS